MARFEVSISVSFAQVVVEIERTVDNLGRYRGGSAVRRREAYVDH